MAFIAFWFRDPGLAIFCKHIHQFSRHAWRRNAIFVEIFGPKLVAFFGVIAGNRAIGCQQEDELVAGQRAADVGQAVLRFPDDVCGGHIALAVGANGR